MSSIARTARLNAAESLWYLIGCIGFGAMYLAKVPAKKALSEAGLAQMTSAEQLWYLVQCIAFGAGYFAKLPVKKALTEVPGAANISYVDFMSLSGGSHPPRQHYQRFEHGRHAEQRSRALAPARHSARHSRSD